MKPPRNITGQKFGRLTAIKFVEIRNKNKHFWEFKCDCGNTTVTQKTGVMGGHTTSCGCFRKEVAGDKARVHGMSNHYLYDTWLQMRSRCHNPDDEAYHYYGARGIKVCQEWRNSFPTFVKDMGERPPNMSLDRINNDGDYSKQNCRWATQSEQLRNYRRNVKVEYQGSNYCLKDICAKLGINYNWADNQWKKGLYIELIIPGARLL
jgi:hypothetical protein